MEIRITADSVEIGGYVNAIERNSRILQSRIGKFVEKVCKGAFKNAIKRNDDIHILLNHDESRDLGSTKQGNLELEEDAIGLKARAVIKDPEVIKKARNNELVGWSFGFHDVEVEKKIIDGLTHRAIKELDLVEVSIIDRTKKPAYEGTLISARSEGGMACFTSEGFAGKVEIREEKNEEKPSSAETSEEKAKIPIGEEYFNEFWKQIKQMEEN